MPVFTFEKIAPPGRGAATPPAYQKQRGVFVQILDRISPMRGKRTNPDGKGAASSQAPKASDKTPNH